MKEKYEKPALEIMRVELNECIASSGPRVKQGQSVHQIFEGAAGERKWGGVTKLGPDGKPI